VYDLIVNAGFAPTFVPADAAAETVEATEPAAE